MPRLWQQTHAQVQVAAANDAGQSPWEVLQIPLTGLAPDAVNQAGRADSGLTREVHPENGAGDGGDAHGTADPRAFVAEMYRHQGATLYTWLEDQKKPVLSAWLRSVHAPCSGSKAELVDRAARLIERSTKC